MMGAAQALGPVRQRIRAALSRVLALQEVPDAGEDNRDDEAR